MGGRAIGQLGQAAAFQPDRAVDYRLDPAGEGRRGQVEGFRPALAEGCQQDLGAGSPPGRAGD